MDRLSPMPSFDGSLSHDSAIGTPHKTDSSRVSGTAPLASSPLTAPPTPTNTNQLQAQHTEARPRPGPFDYATPVRQHASDARSRAESDAWPENQIPLPPSLPVEEDNVGGEVVQRVLSLPRRRRTPSLRNAPDLRWDLSQPPRSSPDELGSVVSEDDVPVGRRESQRARLSPVIEGPSPAGERPSPNEERPITPLLPPTPSRQHATRINFSRPTPTQDSRTPSFPRIRHPPVEHHPPDHRPSPLNESPDLRPRRYPGELQGHPAYSPQPSYGSISSRATYSAEEEDPSLSTARLVSVQRVAPEEEEDTGRDEIAIANRQLEPLFARTPPFGTREEEHLQFYGQLRERADRHKAWGQRHPFRHGMRKMWGKVKGFFNF